MRSLNWRPPDRLRAPLAEAPDGGPSQVAGRWVCPEGESGKMAEVSGPRSSYHPLARTAPMS
ncbi:hypothetical protein Kpho02_10380 [Kitasatospora phosalacinea]|uniref:Uncharacterized protein n=1 Tax=Kitasatospora phosalacinea TaxID=2065 RepID=A0A9W6Q543_9ACTN|nr:hypothetical protein Kpho02_10380 [Kitasatospora phosalacinea]